MVVKSVCVQIMKTQCPLPNYIIVQSMSKILMYTNYIVTSNWAGNYSV